MTYKVLIRLSGGVTLCCVMSFVIIIPNYRLQSYRDEGDSQILGQIETITFTLDLI